jgi:hypothetical protein
VTALEALYKGLDDLDNVVNHVADVFLKKCEDRMAKGDMEID